MTESPDSINLNMSRFVGRMIAPVAIAGLIALAAILTLIWVAARGQDQVAAQTSSEIMNAVVSNLESDLGKLVFDYTWWDEALEKLIVNPDLEWAHETIGLHIAETYYVNETFVVADTDWTMFAYRNGVPSRDDALRYFGPGLMDLVTAAREKPMFKPEAVSAYLLHDSGIRLVAVSALTPENPTAEQLVYRPRPVLIHARHMSPDLLAAVSAQFGFEGLTLAETAPGEGLDVLSHELRDGLGQPVGWLAWTPPHPGSALFADILPWLVAGVVVLLILGTVFLRRVMHVARAMAQDAAELALKERQLAQTSKLAVLGEMAAGVVHELNQPLNIIRMATDLTQAALLKRGADAPLEQLSEQLDVIGGQTRRMSETIQSMRIFSRDDYGRKIAFDVVRATNQALNWLRPELAEHRIEVSLQAPAQCGRVYGEPSRFEQVIVNLILNARDAVVRNRKNGVIERCEIALEITDDLSGEIVRLTVRDNGGGIPAESLERVFEPFFTTKGPGEGTGLGLSISYGIIGGMDGELSARNHAAGAIFTVELPRITPKNVAETTVSVEGDR